MFVSKTYEVQDCKDYDALTSDTGKWTKDSGTTVSYASTGATVRNSGWGALKYSTVLTAPTEIEYEMVSAESTAFGYVGLWTNISDGNTNQFQYHLTSDNQLVCDKDSSTYNLSDYRGVYNIKIYSDHIEIHKDGTQIKSYTISLTNVYFVFTPAPNRNNVIKGFKVKSL